MVKRLYILTLMFLLLILPIALAQQSYLTPGVDRASTFIQDGNGLWSGAAVTTQRSGDFGTFVMPLVADIDNDGINEIIKFDGNDLLILNFTTGVGFLTEGSYQILNQTYGDGNQFWQTPGLIDYDSDGFIEIIVMNASHFFILEFNGTDFTLENSTTHGGISRIGNMLNARYPVIKCATGLQWEDGNNRCVTPFMSFVTPNQHISLAQYNLNDNIANMSGLIQLGGADISHPNTHLVDIDNDGFLEMLYRNSDQSNSRIFILKGEIDANGNPSLIQIHKNLNGSTAQFTDIIINNLDGVRSDGLEITFGYTIDGINWDAQTMDKDGNVLQDSYCNILTCPEGELSSFNMWVASDTTYSDFSNDVCYYIRNSGNNDPGVNIDTVHCISLFAGAGTKETEIINTEDLTFGFSAHEVSLQGSTGILTSEFFIEGDTKQTYPDLSGTDIFTIPVDYQMSGTLDVIGINATVIRYYDDAIVNANIEITKLNVDTGNPVCQSTLVTFTGTLTDDLNDAGQCHLQELYPNSTVKSIQDNKTFATLPSTLNLNYYADEIGTFIINYRCRDQFHDSFIQRSYTVTVSNDTSSCLTKGQNPQTIDFESTDEIDADAAFTASMDGAFEDLGMISPKAKAVFWLIIMIAISAGVVGFLMSTSASFSGSAIMFSLVAINVTMLIIGWLFGFIGSVILVILGLMFAAVTSIAIVRGLTSTA